MTPDALVIGSGPNGLTAANLLADAGWSVIVLEAADDPGGAVRSAEITAPGYRSDLCSAFYPLGAASPVFASLRLDRYGLRWRRSPAALAHATGDGPPAVLHGDVYKTAASLDAFADGDGEAWARMHAEWRRLAGPILTMLFTPFPPVRATGRLLARSGSAEAFRLARRMAMSVREFGEENFAGEGARRLLTGCALHSDVSPEGAGSSAFGWLLAMTGQQYGFPVPEGGAQAVTDALVARLYERGGELECGSRAVRILRRGGRATGVVDADGRTWRAGRAILADIAAPVLYRDLVGLDALPSRMAEDVGRIRLDNPVLKVDWALSAPVPWSEPALADVGTVHIGGDTAALSRWSAALAGDAVPADTFVLLGQMSAADPTRSPAGTETVWAYTHLPRHLAGLGRDDGRTLELVARMEEAITARAPGFADRIVGRYVQGPADFAAENPAMLDGALGSGTATPYQELVFRPVPGLGRSDTPIDGLYLASGWAHPGAGVHGGPGANAARAALRRSARWTGGAYRALVGAAHRLVY